MNEESASKDGYVYMDGNDQKEGQFVLSAESISAINNLFEEFKVKRSQGAVVDLKNVQSAIKNSKHPTVPLDVFDIFFKEYMKYNKGELQTSIITEMQFAELIQDCEHKLIESNGVYRFVDSDGSGQ